MKETAISNCYVSPSPSTEQFIANHTFMYLLSGSMTVYDGINVYKIKAGDYGLGRRNHLARYTKHEDKVAFRKIFILLDQDFLKSFNETYNYEPKSTEAPHAIFHLSHDELIENFIQSLIPYFNEHGLIDGDFLNVKRSELLLILLKSNPDLANILFDFKDPDKIDLEEFMLRNYKFNVSIERFAYLTGRSLSTFKRDFEKIFNATPRHWLIQKRLEEAYYLIDRKEKRPSEIYLDLGFENFSHFSYAFKKLFGHAPSKLFKEN
ncbi:AraC family transcriptional regulator [Marinilongibacter aquaticus]|uniref:helix-turn-helix domain-containing protein n=1 Tax=Marinilongibacter aquaticus TaxID=2975157 RepID=UPI0021BD76C4|nr:AraC family transcriptional regulator [Marinilongibacter aquaticus]UBM59434.1 AraC family transcriptional regulator [Marinilongibacter aquaticus]